MIAYRSLAIAAGSQLDSIDYQRVPAESLKPERSASIELRYRRLHEDGRSMEIVAYYKQRNHLIQTLYQPVDREMYPRSVNSTIPQAANSTVAQSHLYSIQLISRSSIRYASNDFFITWAMGREDLPSPTSTTETIGQLSSYRMVPQWFVQWIFTLRPSDRLRIQMANVWSGKWLRRYTPSLEAEATDSYTIENYYTLDIRMSYTLRNTIQVFGEIHNVFNKAYGGIGAAGTDLDLFYQPQLGRNLYIGVGFDM